jgi:hypothetical protein
MFPAGDLAFLGSMGGAFVLQRHRMGGLTLKAFRTYVRLNTAHLRVSYRTIAHLAFLSNSAHLQVSYRTIAHLAFDEKLRIESSRDFASPPRERTAQTSECLHHVSGSTKMNAHRLGNC